VMTSMICWGCWTKRRRSSKKKRPSKQKKKTEYESELFVGDHCKIRVDPLTRAISVDGLRTRLRRWTFVSLINLPLKLHSKCVTSRQFVVIGVLSSKEIKMSKNNNRYLMLKIDDFRANVTCFVFSDDIISNFCKIMEGTVLVLASPTIMSERNQSTSGHSKRSSQEISLKIEEPEQVLVVGKSLDFAFCPKMDHRQNRCRNVINKATHDLCEFHKAAQYKKFAAKRNDTNRTSMSRSHLKQNRTRSLSGPGNGISMVQRRTRQSEQRRNRSMYGEQKKANRVKVDHKANREKNRAMLLQSGGMTDGLRRRIQKYGNGGKSIQQIQDQKKKRERDRLLAGKALIPHLGANWGHSPAAKGAAAGIQIVFEPKATAKGAEAPAVDGHSEGSTKLRRKRSFKEISSHSADEEDGDECPSRKRPKTSSGGNAERAESEEDDVVEVGQNSVAVTVFVCMASKCSLRTKASETLNDFCRGHRGNVTRSTGRKYFWKCDACGHRIHTLNTKKTPRKCKCGRNKWLPTSATNKKAPKRATSNPLN